MAKAIVVAVVSLALATTIALATGGTGARVFGVPITMVSVAIAFSIQWLVFVPSYLRRTEHFYDLTGSATYLATIWFALAVAGAWSQRGVLLAVLVSVWAARLGSFLFARVRKEGKDGRFDELKQSASRFFVAWTLQGLWVYLTLAAALAAIVNQHDGTLSLRDAGGFALWCVGFVWEVVADAQKSAFRREHPGRFVNHGLWAWSRHPNYFGEIVLWVGIAVIASSSFRGWAWMGLISPLFVFVLLTRISGIPLLQRRADARWGDLESYQKYKKRTPLLVPRPPR